MCVCALTQQGTGHKELTQQGFGMAPEVELSANIVRPTLQPNMIKLGAEVEMSSLNCV